MATLEALFMDGRIFSDAANGSYTHEFLCSFRESKTVLFGQRKQVGTVGWPVDAAILDKSILFARQLYELASAFMKTNFPDHTWHARYRAFACGLCTLRRHLPLPLPKFELHGVLK